MSHDNDMRTQAPAQQSRSSGHSSQFLCGECNKPKGTLGRRLRFVRKLGLRVYVCRACDEQMQKARAK